MTNPMRPRTPGAFETAGASAGSYIDRQIERAEKWIDEHVPHHTRAEYRDPLMTNSKAMLRLVALEMANAQLEDALYQTQKEAVRGIPMPSVKATASMDCHPMHRSTVHSLQWRIDPFRANISLSEDPTARFHELPYMIGAFKRVFHDEYVPALWAATEEAFRIQGQEARGYSFNSF